MKINKQIIRNVFLPLFVAAFAACLLTSCGTTWNGSYGQQAVQHYAQSQKGGKYVGNATSDAEARRMAADAGYSGYNYYPSTGEVFGY